jgi:hypothetical protein
MRIESRSEMGKVEVAMDVLCRPGSYSLKGRIDSAQLLCSWFEQSSRAEEPQAGNSGAVVAHRFAIVKGPREFCQRD